MPKVEIPWYFQHCPLSHFFQKEVMRKGKLSSSESLNKYSIIGEMKRLPFLVIVKLWSWRKVLVIKHLLPYHFWSVRICGFIFLRLCRVYFCGDGSDKADWFCMYCQRKGRNLYHGRTACQSKKCCSLQMWKSHFCSPMVLPL